LKYKALKICSKFPVSFFSLITSSFEILSKKDLLGKKMYLTSIHRHQLPIFFCYGFRGHLYTRLCLANDLMSLLDLVSR
jgi:hypothetical protein